MKKRTLRRYDPDFKKFIVGLLLSGKAKSVEELRRRFSIGGKMSIQRWLKDLGWDLSLLNETQYITLEGQFNELTCEIEHQKSVIRDLEEQLALAEMKQP